MKIRSRFVTYAIVVGAMMMAGAALPMRAQNVPDSGATIRTETRVVLVDAVAVDKKGKFARDLAEKDFKLTEDGKDQKISSFSLESAGISPERSKKHYIAMFFDTSGALSGGQLFVRQEGVKFIDSFASPDRYMAVAAYSYDGGLKIPQNFTTNADALKKALTTLQASAGATPVQAKIGASKSATSDAPVVPALTYRAMLASLREVANSLAAVRGRKALVFFMGSASVDGSITADITATIDACNKANVAIYTVGAGPGSAASAGSSSASSRTAPPKSPTPARPSAGNPLSDTQDNTPDTTLNAGQNVPRALSEETGGISFVTTNDLANSLGMIAAEQDEYYLIGYTPAADSAEGSCHDLKLKVDRGDLEVRARKSYCTEKPADGLAGKPAGSELETRAASGGAGNITAKMQTPWFYSEPNVARVRLALDFMPPAMKFQKDKGKLHGEFNLAAVALKPDGSAAARFSDTVRLEFDTQQQADAFLKLPYHYENQLDVAPGQYNLRMAVGAGDQGFGKAEAPLKIDPWNGQTLSASGIALSHNTHVNADLTAGLDPSLLVDRSRPLVANGTEVVPSGSSQFQPGEPGFFYVEAYEPLLAGAKAGALPLVGVRVRVLDRGTGQQKTDTGVKTIGSFMRAGNPVVPIVSGLPTATLPAGAYRLEVSIMRQEGDPVVRTADFDVK